MGRWLVFSAALCGCLAPGAQAAVPGVQQVNRAADFVSNIGYFLEDYQYYRPMVADIRVPVNHMRLYRGKALQFTDGADDHHLYWDVGMGEFFPLFGFRYSRVPQQDTPRRPTGIAFFIEGTAHMLLDFGAPSNAVIDTDFRFGGGAAARLPRPFDFLSMRYRFFHESTHLGDEYTLLGVRTPATTFRRDNVSYEANELYVAVDRLARRAEAMKLPLLAWPRLSYVRAYSGGRRLNHTAYEEVDAAFTPTGDSLRASSRYEYQLGGELFFRGWPAPEVQPRSTWLGRLLAFQHVVVAADLYRRDQYDQSQPQRRWCTNLVAGLVYGEYFEASRPTVRWLLNYYHGVNPHGQFRQEKLEYLGFDFVIDF